MFLQELKEPPAYLSSKKKKIRDKVDSRVQLIWRLRVIGSWRDLNVKTLKLPDAQQNENIQFTIGFEAKKKKNSCWITFDSHSYSLLNPVKISYDIIPLGRSGYDMYKSLQVLAGNILVPFGFFIIVSFFFTRVTKFDSWNEKSGIRCILVSNKLKEKSNKNTITVLNIKYDCRFISSYRHHRWIEPQIHENNGNDR